MKKAITIITFCVIFFEAFAQTADLSPVNIMRDGSVVKIDPGPKAWYSFKPDRLKDGVTNSVSPYYENPALTVDAQEASNNGRGFVITFNRPVSLGRIVKYGYKASFDAKIEYFKDGKWIETASIPDKDLIQNYDFNLDGSISSSYWRWYISNWAYTETNYYVYEIEAYERIPQQKKGPGKLEKR